MKLTDITNRTVRVITEASENGFVTNIEDDTIANSAFRKVVYTSGESQLVLMSVDSEIGVETHDNIDQFIRIESGTGYVMLGDKKHQVQDGTAIVIPAGVEHNVVNIGTDSLKLYAVYSPPEHQKDVVQTTKKVADKSEEHFDGATNLKESYMPSLEVGMPVLTFSSGVGNLLRELSGQMVREKEIGRIRGRKLFICYVGKLPSKNELANMVKSKYGIKYEEAIALIRV